MFCAFQNSLTLLSAEGWFYIYLQAYRTECVTCISYHMHLGTEDKKLPKSGDFNKIVNYKQSNKNFLINLSQHSQNLYKSLAA